MFDREDATMTDLLSGLNAAQRQAVTETEGFVRAVSYTHLTLPTKA